MVSSILTKTILSNGFTYKGKDTTYLEIEQEQERKREGGREYKRREEKEE